MNQSTVLFTAENTFQSLHQHFAPVFVECPALCFSVHPYFLALKAKGDSWFDFLFKRTKRAFACVSWKGTYIRPWKNGINVFWFQWSDMIVFVSKRNLWKKWRFLAINHQNSCIENKVMFEKINRRNERSTHMMFWTF